MCDAEGGPRETEDKKISFLTEGVRTDAPHQIISSSSMRGMEESWEYQEVSKIEEEIHV